MEGSGQSRWLGQESKFSVGEDIVGVEMLEDKAIDNLFKKLAADELKRDRSVSNWRQHEGRQIWKKGITQDSFQALGTRSVERLRERLLFTGEGWPGEVINLIWKVT